ncbi:MAG: hypothetical protein Q7I98_04520 [Erysipelotrichaceae bacterium]|nr:hypothetical protein [Erysipelotrichaceae bacterium]
MKSRKKKAFRFLVIFALVELSMYYLFSSRMGEGFNFEYFFFIWAFLSFIIPLVMYFGVESRGNLLALGRVYDHNNVNNLEQMDKNRMIKGYTEALSDLLLYIVPFTLNLAAYFILA